MNKTVRLRNVNSPQEIVVLNTVHGTFSHPLPNRDEHVHGNYMTVGGQEFGVFASDNNLYFQWNSRRRKLHGLGPRVTYVHDFRGKTTSFSVDDERIQYPAWWIVDTTFDPSMHERDEDEDFLAYVADLAKNDELQKTLIQSWDK